MATTVKDLQREAKERLDKSAYIYNPDTEDFTVKYGGKPYTIMALDSAEFSFNVANHIKKHLAKKLLFKRGIKRNHMADLKEIEKEIEMGL